MPKDLNSILLDDRVLHFAFTAAASQPITACVRALPFEYRVVTGLVTGFLIGFAKELFDENWRNSPFSFRDLGYSTLGGAYSGVFG